jgi:hypothetical protein
MQVIAPPSRAADHPGAAPVVLGTVLGTVLIVFGVVLALVAFATPLLTWVMPTGRLGAGDMALGMLVWSLALVAPAGLVIFGANRLARILGGARRRLPRPHPLSEALADVSGDVVLARGLNLPDGRPVPDLLVGQFGAVVVRQMPPIELTRIRNGHWEVRGSRGWIPLENPIDRATRDADRVRRWLAHDDADFVVKTYAAVIGDPTRPPRTPACAVLTLEQLPPWLAALPAQRSLTPGRIERMLDVVREAATG